jgi:hypothetical protein
MLPDLTFFRYILLICLYSLPTTSFLDPLWRYFMSPKLTFSYKKAYDCMCTVPSHETAGILPISSCCNIHHAVKKKYLILRQYNLTTSCAWIDRQTHQLNILLLKCSRYVSHLRNVHSKEDCKIDIHNYIQHHAIRIFLCFS